MGDFRIVIEGVGGHGCDRAAKEGEALAEPCGKDYCPDCATRAFVKKLSCTKNMATFTHWPAHLDHRASTYDPAKEVVDDLLAEKRVKGDFFR